MATFTLRVRFEEAVEPLHDGTHVANTVPRLADDDDTMGLTVEQHQVRLLAHLLESDEDLLRLLRWRAVVGEAGDQSERSRHTLQLQRRRQAAVLIGVVPRLASHLARAEGPADVARAIEGLEQGDGSRGDRRLEAVGVRHDPQRRITAVARAAHPEPLRVGEPRLERAVDELHEERKVRLAPVSDDGPREALAVSLAAWRVAKDDRIAGSREDLEGQREAPSVSRVRPTVDVEE